MSDLIDKQVLLEEIENGIRAGNYEEGYEQYPNINNIDDIIECIRYADVVQSERKTGRWERHYSRPNVYADLWWHCSVCGYKNADQYANRYHHYCPHCGAKMEVEHDS